MPTLTSNNVPATEAIEFLRQKLRVPTKSWDVITGRINAKAFLVAGATEMALLGDLHDLVVNAKTLGLSSGEFEAGFADIVKQRGWKFNGSQGWRSALIYDNNMRSASMAGRWKQIQRTKKDRPYLMYLTADDGRVREQHNKWKRIILPIDHPFWDTHYPPNGYGCRCYIITVSEYELEQNGWEVSTAPEVIKFDREVASTGEVFKDVPEGIDIGWDFNVGKTWLGPDIAFGRELARLPKSMRNPALTDAPRVAREILPSWQAWEQESRRAKRQSKHIETVGFIQPAVLDWMAAYDKPLDNAAVTITARKLRHSTTQKNQRQRLSDETVANLPLLFASAKAVLFDKRKGGLVYVVETGESGKGSTIPIAVNRREQGELTNSVRTLGEIDEAVLKQDDFYEVISGGL